MTVNLAGRRARPRWLALALFVLCLTGVGAGIAAGHGAAVLPSGYQGSTQNDVHGANDVPGQVDVTMMGRDNTLAPKLRIFWSWDSISAWTGTGQTGDACALFDDNDSDAFIDYVVCARVNNPTAAPAEVRILPAATDKPVYIFDCSNKKDDRCTNPSPRPYSIGEVKAGPIGSPNQAGSGDLITHLDPFDEQALNGPGESHPHDSTVDIEIAASLVPANVGLANVCSYPSAGNGGNNNPFDCIVTPGTQYGTLRIVKNVTNDNGGTKGFADFSYAVNGATAVAFDSDGITESTVPVGSYSIVEPAVTGYTPSYANNKNANANCTSLAVTVGATTTCTITNDDNAPSLTLIKEVTKDNGGTAVASAWTLQADKQGTSSTAELSGTTGVTSGATFAIGTYNLSETGGPAGYEQTSLTCSDSGSSQVTSVTLSLGESVTCTFVNNDKAPSLTLVKDVINDNGGDAVAANWTLAAAGYDANSPDAGTYTLSESGGPSGYTQTSLTCDNSTGQVTSVTLALDEDVTCTFVNNDNAPGLTLIKHVVNDNGGGAVASAWTLSAGSNTVTGSEAGVLATSTAGTYNLSESAGPGGYTQTSLTCSDTGTTPVTSVTVSLGEAVTCTFVNDDNAPSLTLVKHVVNDNGDIAVASAWTLHAGSNSVAGSEAGLVATTTAGTYSLSETGGPSSYTRTSLTCSDTGATQVTSVTLSLGETVTCTFVNDDAPATPGFATDVDAQIRDNVKITGRGTPSGTVDFFLYSDPECAVQVGSDLNVALANGQATSKYFDITASDTYYWKVHYDGDANNAAATGSCGEAIKVESADFASVLTAGAGFVLPLLAWAAWSRRRRDAI